MAKSIHVKANKPWKRIEIPKGGFDNIFDGLVDVQELTDYEFVKTGRSVNEKKNKKCMGKRDIEIENSGSKKKKIERQSNEKADMEKEIGDESSGKEKVKKKKGRSRKKKITQGTIDGATINFVDGSRFVDTSDTEAHQKSEQNTLSERKKKKGKSRKRKRVEIGYNNNEHITNDTLSMNIGRDSGVEIIGSEKNKKMILEKQRKRKNSPKDSFTLVLSNEEEKTMQNCNLDMSKWSNLFVPKVLLKSLQEQGFQNPTTIQNLTLPSAIRDFKDILAAAETGSGKTLAFGIPVLGKVLACKQHPGEQKLKMEGSHDDGDDTENLEDTVESDKESNDDSVVGSASSLEHPDVDSDDNDESNKDDGDFDFDYALGQSASHLSKQCDDDIENDDDMGFSKKVNPLSNPPQVLILEPTRELAVQVHKHLSKLAKYTDIKFATVVGGMSVEKQRRILKRFPEVIIATPGRLWQLIEEGDKHLSQVDLIHSLVVDEADRMVEKGHYEELTLLLEMINTSPRRNKKRQSFVMSATLTMQVAIPKRLLNKKKEKDLEKDKLKNLTKKICLGTKPKVFDLTPKDKTAQSLTEMRINCSMDEKDFYLYYFLSQHPGRTLVFANSKDCLRRLVSVFNLLECFPYPLHADMQQRQRLKNLDRFSANEKGLLLASDVAARGLDIPNVDYVIHYQVPHTKENYVHRSGRTARASNVGLSVMLVSPEDTRNYTKIVQGVKNGEDLPLLPIDSDLLPAVRNRVNLARSIDVAEHRSKKIRLHNDFFTKAAEEMEMIVDDKDLVPVDDVVLQSEEKNKLKGLKHQLSSMLKGSLAPLRMTKYPTKSGKLLSMKSVDLLKAV